MNAVSVEADYESRYEYLYIALFHITLARLRNLNLEAKMHRGAGKSFTRPD